MNPETLTIPTTWTARVEADAEPALLARLLQKLTCQGATIQTLHYRRDTSGDDPVIQLELTFLAAEFRAGLLAKQWRTIVPVRRVELMQAVRE